MGKLFPLCVIVVSFYMVPLFASAQVGKRATPVDHETIEIIVTTSTITIGTNFSGRDLYIAGVLDNTDPLFRQQNRYDIIVSLEGQTRPMVVWEKKRNAGVWVNADSLIFKDAPLFYSMVTTREISDITSADNYRRLGLGLSYFRLQTDERDQEKIKIFRNELIKLQKAKKLYTEKVGEVHFGSASLFTAYFRLPKNVPVGPYRVRAYLFRDGQFIDKATTTLKIVKAHIAYAIFHEAHKHSFLYGIGAVLVAVATGFLCRLVFRKD
ncbi:putative membrane protein [Bartonella australis AUST/NH1]|uniref:Putative membrane protein n=1 Tax=Bartonella australis (strain Aust/NH1) TaxID=1094489 RepID=M1NZD2_BARAA|nr:TIGR02186 family protein [Bartonella australis]AGF74792.1 putative membrane protein [Bartonella australis AUST/NH1]